MVEDFIEDYISEESSLSVTQTKWTIAGSIITTGLLVVSVIWLTIKLKKLEKMVAALTLTAQIPLTKGEELMTPNISKVVCQDTWLAILLALASVIGIIIYLIKSCKCLTLCRGHIFANTMTIHLVICEEIRYVNLKLRMLPGHLHKPEMESCLYSSNVTTEKGWIWDTLCIDWQEVTISYNRKTIITPSRIIIPLVDKVRTRNLLKQDYDPIIMVKQGRNWLNSSLGMTSNHNGETRQKLA